MLKRKYDEALKEESFVVPDEVQKALEELTEISEELGGYDTEPLQPSDKPSAEAIAAGAKLTGSPDIYNFPVGVVNQLVHFGIAADAGNGTLMRGFRWFQFYK